MNANFQNIKNMDLKGFLDLKISLSFVKLSGGISVSGLEECQVEMGSREREKIRKWCCFALGREESNIKYTYI